VASNLLSFVKGSTALYERIGDVNAFALVQQHFEQLQRVTTRHGGAIIKSIGDAIMVAFVDPADAVAAAIDMRREIAASNLRQPDRALILKIGVHRGAAIAVTLNDRLDCFGQTVNIAARVQNLADADEICISRDAYDANGVKEKQRAPAWRSAIPAVEAGGQAARGCRVRFEHAAAHRVSPPCVHRHRDFCMLAPHPPLRAAACDTTVPVEA
jgi:class 3 adenylate cyclase